MVVLFSLTKSSSSLKHKKLFLFKDIDKGYVLYDLQCHHFFLSRNVILYENVFPFTMSTYTNVSPKIQFPLFANSTPIKNSHHIRVVTHSIETTFAMTTKKNVSKHTFPYQSLQKLSSQPTRHSTRISHKPSYLANFHYHYVIASSVFKNPITGNCAYPLSFVLDY